MGYTPYMNQSRDAKQEQNLEEVKFPKIGNEQGGLYSANPFEVIFHENHSDSVISIKYIRNQLKCRFTSRIS